ncbi:tRNA (N6-isopentenyl adenosine(37)-C2)-methylthiotransferase MiaB [Desulfitobacterium chlororespirans]|uniref:tRNA-2-methylthio-N(6)-dimethylallyladenosine synthase n=1 Tax=Desulfitobacterium chlororespirans DSM 11544 TaxID=1121395 RepID=A0A1M7UMR0_9FIRM|nr:tRNA (N6-isopentenyl adenosine(37)-C2)-methylthiotransferase MiaB [Desulfitobacterium chlororespirans]SHN84177.1 tRNA-i(6)A37 thiotransferase enzyme MiaB [Desulfitobacterium chlororespirans DSM 11544]
MSITKPPKKVVTLAYGCQMSERDADTLTEISSQKGYVRSQELEQADLIIVNTCCVRESAENKILGKIGELKHLKEANPQLKIAISGCMVQQPGALERLRKRAPHVDIWAGTHNIHEFQRLLEESEEKGKVAEVWEKPRETQESVPLAAKGKLKAYVNISYGCDNFCTYCIVPHVRGRERSRQPEEIVAEIRALVETGCREVTLLGQNVNSYGQDLDKAYDFADLLKDVDSIDGLWRVRFMTSHPKDLSDKLIETIAAGTHLCEHVHLPFQAGSDEILKSMNRKYTREYYLSRIAQIKAIIPQASLTTDIIVGFPGETEEDFEQTLELIRQVRYSQAFTFMYSKRSGTPAAQMAEQIPLDIKKRRLQQLITVQNAQSLAWRQEMIGKTYEVLVEGPSKSNPDRLTGRTRGYELVVFPGEAQLIGTLVQVLIEDANSWTLFGKCCKDMPK